MTEPKQRVREDRRSGERGSEGPRSPFQRDRDRLLFSTDFHRLADITQVISPEGHSVHNRLTHTLEVAQIGLRMAQRLFKENRDLSEPGLLSSAVVEAACLAHDLGHPPFGHVAEKELDRLGKEHGGFEGNAQSFRIVTRLAVHRFKHASLGIDLTAATLNAILKYPWLRKTEGHQRDKFGAYEEDREAFDFARELTPHLGEEQSIEAQIMDHADAIAYAVHDMIDFYKAGLLPLEDVFRPGGIQLFISRMNGGGGLHKVVADTGRDLFQALQAIDNMTKVHLDLSVAYGGTRGEQYQLKEISSDLINRYIMAPQIEWRDGAPKLVIPPEHIEEISFLKDLIFYYIINRPQLGTQQEGMRHIIRELFSIYKRTIEEEGGDQRIIPPLFYPEFEAISGKKGGDYDRRCTRLAIDIVAGLSDRQAISMFKRLRGMDLGRVTDFISG